MRFSIIFLFVIVGISFCQNLSYAQDSTIVDFKKAINELNKLRQDLQKQNEKTESLLDESERNFELASKIIDWSSMFFATLVVVLGIAGWIGARRFKQIDETGKEMAILLEDMKDELSKMQQLKNENQKAIDDLKMKFERERKALTEIIHYMNQGENAYEKGEMEKAIEIYTKIIKLKPDSAEAHYMLGNAYSANGDQISAIDHFEKAVELRTDYYEAFNNLGRALRRYGDWDASIKHIAKALEINPKFVTAIINLGHAYLRKGDLTKAVSWYQKSIDMSPDDPLPHLCLGRIAYLQGEIEKAIKLYNVARTKIEKRESEGKIRHWDVYHLGEIFLVLSNIENAESYHKKAFAMNSAKETLRAMKYNLDLLKSSPIPPANIDKFVKLFDEKLGQ